MIFPESALEAIAAIIQGAPLPGTAEVVSGRFSIATISKFFENFGGDGLFPRTDSPDAAQYVLSFIIDINGTTDIDRLICAVPGFCASHEYRDDHPNTIAYEINKILKHHGFRLKKHTSAFSGFSTPSFVVESEPNNLVDLKSLPDLAPENVRDSIEKARDRLKSGDFSGAISSSYTTVESLIKSLLRHFNIEYSKGDIKHLYNLISESMNLNPAGHNLESYQRSILQGLKSLITGLYEVANKAGDRHDAIFESDRHHAKLAVNAAFTLCEFLLDSFEYQQRQEQEIIS